MNHTVLLYGATGYSGRLIAAEAERVGMADNGSSQYRMVLAGRDQRAVAELARLHRMRHRVFGLGTRDDVVRHLTGIDVIVNAAGPFALTANHLARAALIAGCHYVDISGEAEVYMRLDDLGRDAAQRKLAMVSGAGHTAAASDLLLYAALAHIREEQSKLGVGKQDPIELGAVRIALSRITTLSRGSLETLWRGVREQVRVGRVGEVYDPHGKPHLGPVLWHEPVGRLERAFDFDNYDAMGRGDKRNARGPKRRDLRIATAANLVDTLTTRQTLDRCAFSAHHVESYVEAGTISRLGYQVGTLLAPLAAIPWARDLARLQISALPAGPARSERDAETHVVVLEVDDPFHNRIVDWCWHTPNPYDFTARVVVEIAKSVVEENANNPQLAGWLTPSEVLRLEKPALTSKRGYLRGCRLAEPN